MVQTYISIKGETRDAASLSVPQDRTFRNAWQFEGDVIEIDMVQAKEIHKERLRQERKPILEALDIEWFRAVETDDIITQTNIAKKKQILRDITEDERIETANIPKDLQLLTLENLLK